MGSVGRPTAMVHGCDLWVGGPDAKVCRWAGLLVHRKAGQALGLRCGRDCCQVRMLLGLWYCLRQVTPPPTQYASFPFLMSFGETLVL